MDEYHDINDTDIGKDCWVSVYHPTPTDPFMYLVHYSTSKKSGWALPAEWQTIDCRQGKIK